MKFLKGLFKFVFTLVVCILVIIWIEENFIDREGEANIPKEDVMGDINTMLGHGGGKERDVVIRSVYDYFDNEEAFDRYGGTYYTTYIAFVSICHTEREITTLGIEDITDVNTTFMEMIEEGDVVGHSAAMAWYDLRMLEILRAHDVINCYFREQ